MRLLLTTKVQISPHLCFSLLDSEVSIFAKSEIPSVAEQTSQPKIPKTGFLVTWLR